MKTYKVTSSIWAGHAYAMYKDGILDTLICELTANKESMTPIGDGFPIDEYSLINDTMWKATELKPRTVAEKVALFCLVYKQYKTITYHATKTEKANMKNVTVNQDLLKAYFTSTAYPLTHTKTMADYVRHYNTVRDLATHGKPVKSAFPDAYDKAYEQLISADVTKLQNYWAHLRNLGWKKTDGTWTNTQLNHQ